jgi:Flp pilus assembly protein TadD
VAGDFSRAEAMFSDILKDAPDFASVWSNRGSVRLSLGKFEEAASDFSRAIELAPTASVPYLNRAIAYEVTALSPCGADSTSSSGQRASRLRI